ncbi:MAG: hypothetical protein OXF50_08005 [Caldilineaceae bacterium]|nr:hypothetical protein [Caldilineaceae bacterium]
MPPLDLPFHLRRTPAPHKEISTSYCLELWDQIGWKANSESLAWHDRTVELTNDWANGMPVGLGRGNLWFAGVISDLRVTSLHCDRGSCLRWPAPYTYPESSDHRFLTPTCGTVPLWRTDAS